MKSHLLRLLVLGLLLTGCANNPASPAPEADILLGPYVTGVTDSSASVLWVTEPNAGASSIEVWKELDGSQKLSPRTDLKAGALPDQPEILHTAVLTGLAAGQKYAYVVKDSRGIAEGSFQTAPVPGSSAPVSFIVYGDTRSYPDRHRAVAEAVRKEIPFTFMVNTGDLVANGMIWELWKEEFFGPAKELLRVAPIWPVRGNHEMDAATYGDLFPGLPNRGLYYSFDYANAHFVMLDSGVDELEADPNMLEWLEKDLAASKATWKFAVYHKPTVDTVGYGRVWGREDVWPILQKHGVDMIFSGHSHVYERFRPIGEKGKQPIVQIVSGGGGAPSYETKESPALEKGYDGIHYCLLELSGDTLKLTTKTPDGEVIDRATYRKAGGLYDKETMDRAMPTPEAWEVAYVLTGFFADFLEPPAVAKATALKVPASYFPRGSVVEIRPPESDNPWGLRAARLEPNGEVLPLPVVPPEGFGVAPQGRAFSPPIRFHLTVNYLGKTYARDNVPVLAAFNVVRRFTPEPPPVGVPRAPRELALDGDLDDWQDVPFLTVPSTNSISKITRLAWGPKGLYGALLVPDANVQSKPSSPGTSARQNVVGAWEADCIEVFIDANYSRGPDATRDPACQKVELYPLPRAGEGKGGSHVSYGRLKGQNNCYPVFWRRTPGGYALEFLIPADALAPARMEKGARLGFHYVLHDDGRGIEQFVSTKGKSSVWSTPLHWGLLELQD